MKQSEAVNVARRQVKDLKDVTTIDVDKSGNVYINVKAVKGEEVKRVFENGNWIYNELTDGTT